jgi:hypothetical protein
MAFTAAVLIFYFLKFSLYAASFLSPLVGTRISALYGIEPSL